MSDFITFPETASWEVAQGCVTFPAEVDGRRIKCVVPTEALKQIARIESLEDPIAHFQAIQERVRDIAKHLLMKGRGIATGQLVIRPEDCPES